MPSALVLAQDPQPNQPTPHLTQEESMAKIPSGDTSVKVTKTLSTNTLEAWLRASEKENGNDVVPGSFHWKHGSRLAGFAAGEYDEKYFDGVSYEVTPIVQPVKGCPIARHHHTCDCGGAGGDR